MDKYLNDVYEKVINIDPESDKKSTHVLRYFIDLFLLGMLKEEPSLVPMGPRVEFLGSYFEGLRICTPNEFDINIVLTLPYDEDDITMTAKNCAGPITSFLVPADKMRGLVATWCNENGEISAGRFRGWMINLGEKVLSSRRTMNVNGEFYTITLKDTGVAMTAVLTDKMDFSIFVDVVIAFQFSLPKIPLGCKVNMEAVQETDVMTYFLVPIEEYDWRVTMSSQEKVLLKRHKCKQAMKLVKYLCRVHHIEMYSYVMKTLFLRSSVAASANLIDQVMVMIESFRAHLFSGIVPNYWFQKNNLIVDIPSDTLESWCKKLTEILKYLQSRSELGSASIFNSVI